MPNFIRIEWSGFMNFPNAFYSGGSKDGDAVSGMFDTEDIVLSNLGSSDYSIDPGELSFPVSPELSFTLKNRDKFTGDFIYSPEYISTLGRTTEYGGHNDEIGDLFIRLYSGVLEKYIYTGFMETFEYSSFDLELTINCTDFIKLLKTEKPILRQYDFDSMQFFFVQDLGGESISQDQDVIVNRFRSDGLPEIPGGRLVDRRDEDTDLQQFEVRDEFRFYIIGADLSNDASRVKLNDILVSVLSGNMDSEYLDNAIWGWPLFPGGLFPVGHLNQRPQYNDFIKRIFLDNHDLYMIDDSMIESEINYPELGGLNRRATLESGVLHCFLQIEESTILCPIILRMMVYFNNDDPQTPMAFHWAIASCHAHNDTVQVEYRGEDLFVFERGRFLHDSDDPDEVDIESQDAVSVTIYDWGKFPSDENDGFFISEGWERTPYGDATDFKKNYLYHGVYFYADGSGNLKASDNSRGKFRPIDSMFENINSEIVSEYVGQPGYDYYDYYEYYDEPVEIDFDIFDLSTVDGDQFKDVFVSDIAQYGWLDIAITDNIVNLSRQINCYLFSNEDGKIQFLTRDLYRGFVDPVNIGLFKEIHPEDVEPAGGRNYAYGKLFYKIEYSDILEVNNLTADGEISITVGREGRTRSSVSPRDLKISNYRTSDLGIPDSITLNKEDPNDPFIIFRDPLSSQETQEFLMTPEMQARLFAQSYPYPTILLPINLDVLFNISANYPTIGIGSLIYIINPDDHYDVYMVKEITYNIYEIYQGGASLSIQLLYLATYTNFAETIHEEYVEQVIANDISEEGEY